MKCADCKKTLRLRFYLWPRKVGEKDGQGFGTTLVLCRKCQEARKKGKKK